ncbi:MAG: TIGR04348 family glycosyltransferase [Acidobacteria bacterium]|nr:MAG: TIGR04348 family glycosyltransferase [Acidobacteriota bacterium]
MKVLIATPAPPGSRTGNRVTADRWARLLEQLGHQVTIVDEWLGEAGDLLVALHARRSFPSIARFHRLEPRAPLIVALTGTDLYADLDTSEEAHQALELASRLVVLQPAAIAALPEAVREKARVIYQSVDVGEVAADDEGLPAPGDFDACVLGHLRPVKDPFRAAAAARLLPPSSRLRVLQAGGALSPDMEERAQQEMEENPRYLWLGELPRPRALRLLARGRLLILSSRLEGGANVVSEAVALGVPVLSTHIDGSIGMLGEDYPGYFPVGDEAALAEKLERAESDPDFYAALAAHCARLKPRFAPEHERDAWRRLLAEL